MCEFAIDLTWLEWLEELRKRRRVQWAKTDKTKPFKISIIPHYTKIQLFPSFKIFPSWSHPFFYLIFRQNNHHFFGTFRDIKYSSQSSWHLSLHLSLVLSFAYVLIPLFFCLLQTVEISSHFCAPQPPLLFRDVIRSKILIYCPNDVKQRKL